jgi:hypothetical protein
MIDQLVVMDEIIQAFYTELKNKELDESLMIVHLFLDKGLSYDFALKDER